MKSKDILLKTATAITLAGLVTNGVTAELGDTKVQNQKPTQETKKDDSKKSDNPNEAKSLSNINVTARRRKEKLQNVPVPIAVEKGDDLELKKVYQVQDLQQIFPNLTAQFLHARQSALAVRGIGNNIANEGLEQSTGIYLDNVYLGRPGMAVFDLLDIEQAELLRGPQGTLFGKNTTAGVLNITTKKPVFDDEAVFEGTYGNRNYDNVRGMVNKKINDDLAVRISAYQTHDDGWVKNVTDGRDLNSINRNGVRGQAFYKPTDSFDLRLIFEHNQENSTTAPLVAYAFGPYSVTPLQRAGIASALHVTPAASLAAVPATTTYPNLVKALGGSIYTGPWKDYINTINQAQNMEVHQNAASAEANWDFEGYKLTSISAWRSWYFTPQNDIDYTNLTAGQGGFLNTKDDQYSQEIRLASPIGKRYDYVVGSYYYHQNVQSNQQYQTGPYGLSVMGLPNNALLNGHGYGTTNSYAFFGQGTFHATDKFDLTAGLRDTLEAKDAIIDQEKTQLLNPADPTNAYGNAAINGSPLFRQYNSGQPHLFSSILSGLTTASYKFNDDILGYVTYSRGSKSGGYNLNGILSPGSQVGVAGIQVRPETADNVELGIKTNWLNNRVFANVNYFQTKVQDYQGLTSQTFTTANGPLAASVLTNIGDITSQGVEFDFKALPIPRLQVGLNGAFTDAVFDSGTGPTPYERNIGKGYGKGSVDISGNKVNMAPNWIINPSLQYSWSLTDKIDQYVSSNYGWRSEQFGDVNNSKFSKIDAYGIWNLSTGWEIKQGKHNKWDVSLWAKNLTDERYALGVIGGNNGYLASAGQPRTVGATVRFTY
ncbi:MAG: TonB-dependent receptor [Methylococcaceae bacterium]|nr:TonB-dependent receptor [Methylococcaceae bacterium]